MQGFPSISFFGGILGGNMRSFPVLIAFPAACGVLRESQLSHTSSEMLGK
ncbi:hypothetical protein KTT_55690 [Tengunoibacter tsumagoiensis]|uniref:Uncharacterized protein n=1 Tax=Tengunoibacter tsumagoiensis TaxID=2014871 RepID=A0A402A986_9CHLR|nr:hypothetical protein KTT_55690 [Tengunoibacter tsumagoiensis]